MAHLQDLSASEVVDVVNDDTLSGLVANGIPHHHPQYNRKKFIRNRFRTRLGAAESNSYPSAVAANAGSLTATGTAYGSHG